jgi:hypothetical protein
VPFNFIDYYLSITKIVESPTSYLKWAAYSVLGATLRHNVFIDFPARRTRITPNIYVLLVGDSGATRKSTPLKHANYLLKGVNNTKIIEGRASIQGVLKELAGRRRVGDNMIGGAGAFLYSEEFAAFLVKDPSTTAQLCDLYDYHDTHDIVLKSEETLKLQNVCVSILSATNAAFIKDMFTKTDLYGGLVGRTFFIIESKARQKNLGLVDESSEKDWDPLIHHLRGLAKLEGRVKLNKTAFNLYEKWYNETDFSTNESKTGFEHRMHTHALKMALIISSATEDFQMHISEESMIEAINIIGAMRKNYHQMVATVGMTQNNVVQAVKDVTVCLFRSERPLVREEILRELIGLVDVDTFDKAIVTLQQANLVEIGGTSVAEYSLTPKGRQIILGSMPTVSGEIQ